MRTYDARTETSPRPPYDLIVADDPYELVIGVLGSVAVRGVQGAIPVGIALWALS